MPGPGESALRPIGRAGGRIAASPVWADGRIHLFADDGRAVVLREGKEMERLAENHLDGTVFASPAIVGDAIDLRTDDHLYCIRRR